MAQCGAKILRRLHFRNSIEKFCCLWQVLGRTDPGLGWAIFWFLCALRIVWFGFGLFIAGFDCLVEFIYSVFVLFSGLCLMSGDNCSTIRQNKLREGVPYKNFDFIEILLNSWEACPSTCWQWLQLNEDDLSIRLFQLYCNVILHPFSLW